MPSRALGPVLLRSALLATVPGLAHGFSTRQGGAPGRDFDLARSLGNQRRFARAVMGAPAPLVQLRQLHGALIWTDPQPGAGGDGAVTATAGRVLAIRTADCCPLLLADPVRRVVGAVHAGWRGTLARIAEKAVGEMRAGFGCDPNDLRAAIGPGIRSCCYTVGEEVLDAFRARFAYAEELFSEEHDPVRQRYPMLFMTGAPPGHPYDPRWNQAPALRLDLALANAHQLRDAGVPAANIDILPYCTGCRADLFFSHRRGDSGRMLAGIGLV